MLRGTINVLFGFVSDGILGVGNAAKLSGLSLKASKVKIAEYEARPTA